MPTAQAEVRISNQQQLRAAIDQIGFLKELEDQRGKPLKDAVKNHMSAAEKDDFDAEYFDAKLVHGTVQTVDPARFFRLWKRGVIKDADFLACITVQRGKANEFMSDRDLDAISDARDTTSLRVTRKKGVEVKLVDALKGVADGIDTDDGAGA